MSVHRSADRPGSSIVHHGTFVACLDPACREARRPAETPAEPPLLSPREHYAKATALLAAASTDARQTAGEQAMALAHATLALVPQATFDAWQRDADVEAQVATVSDGPRSPSTTWSCHLCDRVLFRTDATGRVEWPSPASTWESGTDGVTCTIGDAAGCGQFVLRRLPTPACGDSECPGGSR